MLWIYDALLPLGRLGARVVSPFVPKVRAGLEGRRDVQARLAALGATHAGRILWIHTSSVGEYEQARPLAALLRERFPDLVLLHTFFSPSGFEYARRLGESAHVEYLPEDTRRATGAALDALLPVALVVMKFDLWPNLVREAAARGVPVLLLDATLQPRSWRSRWPARRLYREVYRRLAVVSAVSQADADRFRAVVPEHPAIHVDGDTRYDQVVRRRRAARRVPLAPALLATPRPLTLVAGSTWGPDEAALVPAWRDFVRGYDESTDPERPGRPRLVVVPHEPTPAHLEPLERALESAGLTSKRYGQLGAEGPSGVDAVVVDRVGILAELYQAGDLAYVGGAFSTGVHNLLEPATMGLPLLFGPRHWNAPEATLLLDAGAGSVVRSAADLGRRLTELAEPARRHRMGGQARAAVEANLGAAERCLGRLAPFVSAAVPPARESGR